MAVANADPEINTKAPTNVVTFLPIGEFLDVLIFFIFLLRLYFIRHFDSAFSMPLQLGRV